MYYGIGWYHGPRKDTMTTSIYIPRNVEHALRAEIERRKRAAPTPRAASQVSLSGTIAELLIKALDLEPRHEVANG